MNYTEMVVFIVYLLFMLSIGIWFFYKNRQGGEKTYFLGGRQMGPWVTALSAGASDMSAWVLMGLPTSIYALGLGQAWISIGLLTGMSQGHVAIVMPIVAAMQTGSLNLAGVAMAFGIAGQMLTPTHMCLVITVDYFKANFFKTLKPVLLCEIIILTLFTAYTYFTW